MGKFLMNRPSFSRVFLFANWKFSFLSDSIFDIVSSKFSLPLPFNFSLFVSFFSPSLGSSTSIHALQKHERGSRTKVFICLLVLKASCIVPRHTLITSIPCSSLLFWSGPKPPSGTFVCYEPNYRGAFHSAHAGYLILSDWVSKQRSHQCSSNCHGDKPIVRKGPHPSWSYFTICAGVFLFASGARMWKFHMLSSVESFFS